jgi:hypothetical protein
MPINAAFIPEPDKDVLFDGDSGLVEEKIMKAAHEKPKSIGCRNAGDARGCHFRRSSHLAGIQRKT